MFEPDEFIFTKVAHFLKRKRKRALEVDPRAVALAEIKPRLTLLARAVTGRPIEIFEAEREGGFKNDNYFLPSRFAVCDSTEENTLFYVYRVLYLGVQQRLDFNFEAGQEHSLEEARECAQETAVSVLPELVKEYPGLKEYYDSFKAYFESNTAKGDLPDYTFLHGKWMEQAMEVPKKKALQNISEKVKTAAEVEINTILKANAVEEIKSVTIDQKAQEDYVLTHNFEKVETAEEWEGGWRDFDGEDELDDHANALEDLSMKHTVRVDDPTHSIYHADFIENTTIAESSEQDPAGSYVTYDEWDYKKKRYKPDFCKVYPTKLEAINTAYYKNTLAEYRSVLLALRKMLTSVNNKYQQQRRQLSGEEFDLDAITDLYVDVQSGRTPSENVYLSNRKKEKDLSIVLLLDCSLSSDGYVAGNRVLDVEKQVSLIFGEILNEFNVDFAIHGFYSKTRNYSTFLTLKDFDDSWHRAKHTIGAVEPAGYTRIGPALRHCGALLDARPAKNKWVLLLSDGKPNDYDRYEGTYGIQDIKQALRELNQRQIQSYALAIEAQAKYYLPQMFGQNHYQILTSPVALMQSLAKLYDKIKHQK
ncbi:MAG: NorD protein [Flavobacteriaceae bacterium]|nr:NorD protein [Flavobacteriaceae bacterium]